MNNTLLEYLITAYKVGDFTLTSGKQSDFYIDVKSLMYDARFLSCVSTKMLDIITSKWRDECVAIGGMELGSVPLSTGVSIKSYTCNPHYTYDHFVVRKQAKSHGLGTQIEGYKYIKGQNVVIVDDVLTSGFSILRTNEIIEENNVHCIGAVVVVDRQEIDNLKIFPFPVVSLFTKKDIITAKNIKDKEMSNNLSFGSCSEILWPMR